MDGKTPNACALALFLASAMAGQCQQSPWRIFPQVAGRKVALADNGNVLDVSDASICIFDGYIVKVIDLPREGCGRAYQSAAGQLWTVSAGQLWTTTGEVWTPFVMPGITADCALYPIRHDSVLCLLPKRLTLFTLIPATGPRFQVLRRADDSGIGKFEGLTAGAGEELWVTGETGLGRLANPKRDLAWREILPPPGLVLSRFQNPQPDEKGVTFLAGGQVAARFDGAQWETHPLPSQENFFATWRGLGPTWWAASTNTLLRWRNGNWTADRSLAAEKYFDVAVGEHGTFWLATTAGLARYTPPLWSPAVPDAAVRQRLQMSTDHSLPASVPPPDVRHDAVFSSVLQTASGDVWVGGSFGTAWWHGRWTVFASSDYSDPNNINYMLELSNGRIWAASREKIWSFDGRNWSTVRSGFNHINALLGARDGSVWVSLDDGVTHFIHDNWIENTTDEGLMGEPVLALAEEPPGVLWAKTSNRFERYQPGADTESPRISIETPNNKKRTIRPDGVLTVNLAGEDKWQITPRSRLLYSSRLDEGEWSSFDTNTTVVFSDLSVGKHYFQARAMNRSGNMTRDPAHLEFAVVLPWYKESRLVLIASAGAAVAGFFAVLAYRRHRELVLSYALVEKQVAERTRELESAHYQLLQSQKMRALGTLAASIAHDFNNILSIVKGSAQIIEDNLGDPQKIRARADRIKTVVDQGSAVVKALLGFSSGAEEPAEPCEINPIIDNTLTLLGDRFLREVEVRFDRALALPRVRVPPSLVQQILLNFIFNAAESMNGRKSVVLTTAPLHPLPASMALQPGAARAYVGIAVRDFGCGIPPDLRPRVFEPFFTTKALSTRRGTGLGLSIVYELAKKMEAGLALESTVGQGSVFTLILPADSDA